MHADTHTHTHTHTHIHKQVHMHHAMSGIPTRSQCLGSWNLLTPYSQHYFQKYNVVLSSNICCGLVSRLHNSDETCKVQNVYSGVHIHNVSCLGLNYDINTKTKTTTTTTTTIKHEAKIHNTWIRKCSDSRTILAHVLLYLLIVVACDLFFRLVTFKKWFKAKHWKLVCVLAAVPRNMHARARAHTHTHTQNLKHWAKMSGRNKVKGNKILK